MHIRSFPPALGTTTGLARHRGWWTFRMKPTSSSFLISSRMKFCRSMNCFQGFCYTGLASGQIFKWCLITSLGIPGICDDYCDRTTSKMRGLSPKIISGDSQRSENAQTHTYKHTIPYKKFKWKLLQIKCHVLEFTKDEAQNMLQEIIRVFVEAPVSHDRHTLFALEECEPPRTTYTCESQ
jgi:hypothetical protein